LLPPGLPSRFIVRSHVMIGGTARWRDGNRALVTADMIAGVICIDGPVTSRRQLLVVIPIILRDCSCQAEVAGRNQALNPGNPIATARQHPHDRDPAWRQAYDDLEKALVTLRARRR
jgi:hypothetical protein